MKTITKISIKLTAILLLFLAIPKEGNAQVFKNSYFNADWQINIPVSNSFADKASGWGANFEGGYYVSPNIAVGLFIAYSTNNEHIGRQTIDVTNTSTITGDQQHSVFQLPFGAAVRYSFARESQFEPYAAVKLGANYSEMSTYMNIFKLYDRNWGFYASPEVGINMFLTPEKKFGFHVAAYYSYGSNKGKVLIYDIDRLNNFGVRLGVTF